jgi:hypothetical protein
MLAIDLNDLRDSFERRRREFMIGAAALLVLALIGAVLYWWIVVRWKPPPSIFDNPVDDALGYLALPDFNKLPMEERLKFLMELADRFRGLQPGESAAAAAFLAGIVGPARDQLHENARILAKDILASGAAEYMELPEAERGPFIDKWLGEWMRVGERLAEGKERDRTDEERLGDMRGDMDRNRERMAEREGVPAPSDKSAGRFLNFWQDEVEQAASPKEQGQIVRFMDDIRKHLTR